MSQLTHPAAMPFPRMPTLRLDHGRPLIRPPAWLRLGLLASALLGGGCLHWYLPETFNVTVRDAESGAPIPHARVRLVYIRPDIDLDLNRPRDLPASVTDADGKTVIHGSTFSPNAWLVDAAGYMPP